MNESTPQPAQDQAPDAAARFALVLAVSLALHLALALGIHVRSAQSVEHAQAVLEVRIQGAPAKVKSLRIDRVADQVEKKSAEPKPREENPELLPAPHEPAPTFLPTLEMPLLEDPTWYPAKQVDVHPSPLQPVRPEYPEKAGDQSVGGNITLLLLIDEQGVVREASVMEANPEGYFEASALDAFRAARFAPAQKNGRAVKSRVLIRVTYELGGGNKSGVQPPAPFSP